jgi:general secretion pathway protein E
LVTTALTPQLPLADAYEPGYLEYNGVLPLERLGDRLRVAVTAEPAAEVRDELERRFGAALDPVIVSPEELAAAVRRATARQTVVELVRDLNAPVGGTGAGGAPHAAQAPVADVRSQADAPLVVRYVNLLINDAYRAQASDIHLEATRDGLRARLRVDGVLDEVPSPPPDLQAAVVSRIKLMAELDIAERRAAQDGRVRVRLEERELDLRVATIPTLYGESVVLRLLDQGGRPVTLGDLGMPDGMRATVEELCDRPHGIILATGPTGSGKTTTLYAALARRRPRSEKIVTVEDPVEYHLEGVTQVPVHARAGMTFATALRSILRQDPDVLMVGEMRDPETAAIAVQAAMTGHLVFSTLHTNDAVSAVARLMDLRVEPYLIAATLEAVIAQRLVRRICTDCVADHAPDPQTIARLVHQPVGPVTTKHGTGCSTCRGTGYRGRSGIFELFALDEDLKHAIARQVPLARLRERARADGMRTLQQHGWARVQDGETTVEEVLRVTEH